MRHSILKVMRMRYGSATFFLCAVSLCADVPDRPNLKEVLSWLPADTETIIGENGPFSWTDLVTSGTANDGWSELEVISAEQLKPLIAMLPAGLLSLKNGGLSTFLNSGKVALVVEGSRRFRAPKNLGGTLFEGCAIAVVSAPSAIHGDAFMETSAASAKRFDEIAGVKIAVFEQTQEEDVLTSFVAFPRQDIVLVATDVDYLRTVLARMRGTAGPRALPEALPEWKYVSTRALAWGVRHYQRTDSNLDPTSPFHGQDAANAPDQQAEGATFQFDLRGSLLTVTYLSGSRSARKIMERFLGLTAPMVASLPKMQAHFRQRAPAVLECALPLSVPRALAYVPILGLMAMFGHAVYL